MKHKKWLLLLIIAFPSFFWLILETSTINSRKLPFYGPKNAVAPGDTNYYKVPDTFEKALADTTVISEKLDFPLYAVIFVDEKYRADSYRLTGLWEYLNYKKEKVIHIPFVMVTKKTATLSAAQIDLKKLDNHSNVHFFCSSKFDSLVKIHFKEKPYYIDQSFFLLVDANRNIRGYYDGRYVSEIKRLIEEYQHLRLKEEKKILIKENEIKTES